MKNATVPGELKGVEDRVWVKSAAFRASTRIATMRERERRKTRRHFVRFEWRADGKRATQRKRLSIGVDHTAYAFTLPEVRNRLVARA